MHRPIGITLVAWFYWIIGAILMVSALVGLTVNVVFALGTLMIGGVAFASGIGLMHYQPWARTTALLFAGIMVLLLVIGVIDNGNIVLIGVGGVGALPGLYLLRTNGVADRATLPEMAQPKKAARTANQQALRIVGGLVGILGMLMIAFGILVAFSSPTAPDIGLSVAIFIVPGIVFLIVGLFCLYLGRQKKEAHEPEHSADSPAPRT